MMMVLFCFETILNDNQDLLIALHPEITPVGAWGPDGKRQGLNPVQLSAKKKCLTYCTLSDPLSLKKIEVTKR